MSRLSQRRSPALCTAARGNRAPLPSPGFIGGVPPVANDSYADQG